jgi:hypothetical protein
MAFIAGLPSNYNVLSPLAFRLDIERLPMATFFCQSVNVPGVTLGETEQVTPLINIPIPGDKMEFDSLTATFLIDEDLTNYIEILNWIRGLGTPEVLSEYGDLEKASPTYNVYTNKSVAGDVLSDITLHILTNSKNTNKEVIYRDCFPIALGEIAFDSASDGGVIVADATFQLRDYVIQ